MALPDSGEIDNALVNVLSADAELLALLPDGVYFDEAPQGMQAFALLSLVDGITQAQFAALTERRGFERCEYIVKAVMLSGSSANARKAAARIDELLEDQQDALRITGFTCMSIRRVARIRDTEVDSVDATIRWQHRGGHYAIVAAPGGDK